MTDFEQTSKIQQLYRRLRRQLADYPAFCDISLAPFTTFAIGGNAELLLLPRQRSELFLALELCEELQLPLTVLGGGANVLIADAGVIGVVLSLRCLLGLEWCLAERLLKVEAGWEMSQLCRYSAAQNAAGLHFFYGMPGSLGGAVYMNARCYEGEMAEIVRRVLCIPSHPSIQSTGSNGQHRQQNFYQLSELRWVDLNIADWHYKYSHFQRDSGHELAGALIVAVELALREQDCDSLEHEMQHFLEDRIVKGHFRLPCGGSFFKNNRTFGAPTGQIIDGLGLKGLRFGKAQLAPWHGNIIVNTGSASATEVWRLSCIIHKEVLCRTGFELEPEVQRLGAWV